MAKPLRVWLVVAGVYALFLAWHEPWFVKPLTQGEVAGMFAERLRKAHIAEDEKANLLAFFSSDDGKPFYNINLMLYRDKAVYADGVDRTGVVTGADANTEYAKVVVPLLLRRGSYPVFVSSKIANLLMSANAGADFFQEVGIVRYRSRRDMLEMILDPAYAPGMPHKFASLEKNVATPTLGILVLDARVLVPLVLLLAGCLATLLLRRQRSSVWRP